MSIANLHSILNKPWYIEQNYGASFMPLVLNMINGVHVEAPEEKQETLILHNLASNNNISSNQKQVAVLSIKNPIVKHDQFCGPQGTKSMMRDLEALKTNASIAGIVLDIDSGGGQAYGTPEFHDYLKSYPKPIVAYTDGLMCSAAYYIGSAANHIIANKRAEAIGSIGAYTQLLDLTGYYEKQGAKLHTIYATKSTEKNKAYREALTGEYESYIKEELDPLVETFHADMLSARPQLKEATLKGGTWTGEASLKMGLIDEIGTLETAINKVLELSDNKKQTTMSKERENLQAVLGLETPLATTDNGSYLNEEQLDALEQTLQEAETAINTSNETLIEAQEALNNATTENESIITSVNEALELTGDAKVTTVADAFTAMQNHIAQLGKQPGATHTVVKTEEQEDAKFPYLDFSSPLYNQN